MKFKNPLENIREAWYWLKCRFWHKYNQVTIKNLPSTWTDRCDILPHAMFQILVDFVEKELENVNPFVLNRRTGYSDEIEDNLCVSKWETVTDELISLKDWYEKIYVPYYNGENDLTFEDRPEISFEKFKNLEFHERIFIFRDEKHEQDYNNFILKRIEMEHKMRAELREKMKRLVELHEYMWT